MQICSGDRNRSHEEICHEGSSCPLCEALEDKNMSEKEVEEKDKSISKLEEELDELKAVIEQNEELRTAYKAQVSANSL